MGRESLDDSLEGVVGFGPLDLPALQHFCCRQRSGLRPPRLLPLLLSNPFFFAFLYLLIIIIRNITCLYLLRMFISILLYISITENLFYSGHPVSYLLK